MSRDVTQEQWPAGDNTIIIQVFNSSIAAVGSANSTCLPTDNSADLCDSSLNGEKAHSEQRFVNRLKPNGYYMHHLLWHLENPHPAPIVCSYVVYESQNKQRL